MTLKRAQVVILPTNEKAPKIGMISTRSDNNHLQLVDETLVSMYEMHKQFGDFVPVIPYQHFYFLRPIKSEQNPDGEEIKEGDWAFSDKGCPKIQQVIGLPRQDRGKYGWKKIIATTDSSLITDIGNAYYPYGIPLPQPSQDFIKVFVEEYNKGNVIEWVDVEYEEVFFTNAFESDLSLTVNGLQDTVLTKLKVNSKNEITIRKIKDSWNKEEVKQLCWQAFIDFKCVSGKIKPSEASELIKPFNKWISENL